MAVTFVGPFVGLILAIFALVKSEQCLGGKIFEASPLYSYAQLLFGAMAIGDILVQTSNETLAHQCELLPKHKTCLMQ